MIAHKCWKRIPLSMLLSAAPQPSGASRKQHIDSPYCFPPQPPRLKWDAPQRRVYP